MKKLISALFFACLGLVGCCSHGKVEKSDGIERKVTFDSKSKVCKSKVCSTGKLGVKDTSK